MTLSRVLSVYRGFCVSFGQPLSQPASSDKGELITECFLPDVSTHMGFRVSFVQPLSQTALSVQGEVITVRLRIDMSAPALSPGGDLVRPGVPLLVSYRSGDWGRLLLATHEDTTDCSVTQYVTVFWCSITVLRNVIKQAAPRPSLTCARAVPDAECPLVSLWDTAGCSRIILLRWWRVQISLISLPTDFVLVTLRIFARSSPARGFSRRCLPGFAHRQSDLFASAGLLSAHGGSSFSLINPYHSQP